MRHLRILQESESSCASLHFIPAIFMSILLLSKTIRKFLFRLKSLVMFNASPLAFSSAWYDDVHLPAAILFDEMMFGLFGFPSVTIMPAHHSYCCL